MTEVLFVLESKVCVWAPPEFKVESDFSVRANIKMAENKRDGNQFVIRGGKLVRRKRKSGRFSAGLAATCKTYSL